MPLSASTPVNTTQQRVYHGLMHSSDWLPTLLSYAGLGSEAQPDGMDGIDFSETLRRVPYQVGDGCNGFVFVVLIRLA